MSAHFFDIETVIRSDAKIWIVDKSKPSNCIVKVSQSDFGLIRSGVFRTHGNLVRFAGVDYYLPDEIMNRVKIACKNTKSNSSNLAFSMREFVDPEHIGSINHVVDVDVLRHLKNTQDDVYFICSRKAKKSYETLIAKVEDKLESLGIRPKYYFVSETFYDRDEDATSFDKVRLILQHMVGKRSDGRKFVEENVEQYDEVSFYDEDSRTVQMAYDISGMLQMMLSNSDETVADVIKELVKSKSPSLNSVLVTPNLRNRFSTKSVKLQYSNLLRTYESYRRFK